MTAGDAVPSPDVSLVRRSAWRIFCSVQIALLVRELKTRFGESRLGYAWALIEPASHVVVLSLIFSIRGRQLIPGVDYPIFVLTGIVAYDLILKVSLTGASALEANEGLLTYRHVKPADFLIARMLLELVAHIAAFFVLLGVAAWFGMTVAPCDPLGAIVLAILLTVFVTGFSFIIGVLGQLLPETRKIIPTFTRFLYFISCIIYPLSLVPSEHRHWFLWNPVVHYMELIRRSWFLSYPDAGASWSVVVATSLGSCVVGGMLYWAFRRELSAVK